jgi:hypothetical protein
MELSRGAPLALRLDPDGGRIVERRLTRVALALHALERGGGLGERQRDVVALLPPSSKCWISSVPTGGVARKVDATSPVRVSITVISSGPWSRVHCARSFPSRRIVRTKSRPLIERLVMRRGSRGTAGGAGIES